MPRYVAFLRGVSPVNAKMPQLKRAFEAAGFNAVKTVLASGNVVFDARAAPTARLERAAQKAQHASLGRAFPAIVRATAFLDELLAADPFRAFDVAPEAKKVVTFLRAMPAGNLVLPRAVDGARILGVRGCEVYTAYLPSARGPVFMTLIEKTFGTDVTTRTWDTVRKCAAA